MARGSYLGGSTIIRNGAGFTALPEGGEASKEKSALTPNQVSAQKRSAKIKRRRAVKAKRAKSAP